ncbi:MAG: hypothetical protein ACRD0Z_12160 [Acidimicrobiales bacterium]
MIEGRVEFDDVADELYRLLPGEFTKARDVHAAAAKKAGDPQLSAALKALKRPTVVAWALNQLIRNRLEDVEELLRLGDELRRAQYELAGAEVRGLSQDRRRLTQGLIVQARHLSEAKGQRLGDAVIQELESSLVAGLADPAAADLLLSGRLTGGLSGGGVAGLGLPAATRAGSGDSERQEGKPERPEAGEQPSEAEPGEGRRHGVGGLQRHLRRPPGSLRASCGGDGCG